MVHCVVLTLCRHQLAQSNLRRRHKWPHGKEPNTAVMIVSNAVERVLSYQGRIRRILDWTVCPLNTPSHRTDSWASPSTLPWSGVTTSRPLPLRQRQQKGCCFWRSWNVQELPSKILCFLKCACPAWHQSLTRGQTKALEDANVQRRALQILSLIHIWRCRRIERCRSRWSPYH